MAEEVLTVRAELRDELSRPARAVKRKVRDVAEAVDDAADEGKRWARSLNFTRRNLARLGRTVRRAARGVGRFGRALGRVAWRGAITGARLFGRAMLGVGAALAGALGFGVKLASDLQQTEIALTTMLGSADEAQALLEELKAFSAETPFELPGLIEGTRGLLAMGFASEELLPTLTAVGDTASALGAGEEGISRITRALGQMRAKTKVSAEEMLQLSELGVPAWEVLAQATGNTVAEVQELASKGEISADVFINAFKSMGGPLEKFRGSMEMQSKTLAGLFSTLKDTAQLKLAEVAQPLVEGLQDALPGITERLEEFLDRVGPGLSEAIAVALPPLIDLLGALLEAVAPVLEVMADLFSELVPAIAPIVQRLAPILGQLATVIGDILLTAVEPLLPVIGDVLATLGEMLVAVLPSLMPLISRLAELFAQVIPVALPLAEALIQIVIALLPLLDPLLEIVEMLLPPLVTLIEALAPIISGLANVISVVLQPVIEGIAWVFENVLIPVLEEIVSWFESLAGMVDRTVGKLENAKAAVSDFTSGRSGGWVGRGVSWVNPFGDTATPRARSGSLAGTMGFHSAVDAATPGRRTITNALVGLGGASSDHPAGRALDLQGPFLHAYARQARKMGAYAAFHGAGAGRHLHVAVGDTATPRARPAAQRGGGGGGGLTMIVQPRTEMDVEAAVRRAWKRIQRDQEER